MHYLYDIYATIQCMLDLFAQDYSAKLDELICLGFIIRENILIIGLLEIRVRTY